MSSCEQSIICTLTKDRSSIVQDYSDDKAQEESFQRGFSEIVAGGGRAGTALELVDELPRATTID